MERLKTDISDEAEKIVLPEALQRAMMRFFREAAVLKYADVELRRQTSLNSDDLEGD